MALSTKQRTEIIFHLGHPALILVEDSTFFSGIISDRLDAISANPDICKIALDLLKKIRHIDDCLEKAKCRLAASKVDNITMNDREIQQLLAERKRCIKELASLTGIQYKGRSNIVGVCN